MKFSRKQAALALAGGSMLAIGGGGAAFALAPTSLCPTCIAFKFNYGLGSVTNAGQLNFDDPALVVQQFDSGILAGPNGVFTDTGAFFLKGYNKVAPDGTTLLPASTLPGMTGAGCGASGECLLYLYYNLTGTATTALGQTTLTFNPGGGSIALYTETNYDSASTTLSPIGSIPTPDLGSTKLGEFELLNAGAKGTFALGVLTVTSFAYSFEQTFGPKSDIFQTWPGLVDLFAGGVAKAFELGSANVQAGIVFGGCTPPQGTGITSTGGSAGSGNPLDGIGGAGYYCSTPTAQGNFQVSAIAVPEPGTLGLVGTGLALLGFGAARRRKAARAA